MIYTLHHFGLFLAAVCDHTLTLATGCVVTVIMNLVEKHLIKKSLPLRVDVAVLLTFVFFACFEAWQDEYKRADALIHPAQQLPIVVNIPPINVPKTEVIVQQPSITPRPKSDTYVTLTGISPTYVGEAISVGQNISLLVSFEKFGKTPIRTLRATRLTIAKTEGEQNVQREYRTYLEQGAKGNADRFGPYETTEATYGHEVALLPHPLSQRDVNELVTQQEAMYLLISIKWKNEDDTVDTIFSCYRLQFATDMRFVEGHVLYLPCGTP